MVLFVSPVAYLLCWCCCADGGVQVVAIIDVDCAEVGGFDEVDRAALEELAVLLAQACDF